MSYTYDLRPEASFEDRYSQFIAFGIPKADVETLRATIKDMWADAPGGWSYEWSAFARKYLEAGNSLLASFAYGFAIFPCLANDARRKAQQNQLECYLKAAPSFPVKFERRMLAIPYQGGTVSTPVHLFSVTGEYASAPVLIYTGGVDTYKMGLHAIYVTLAQRLGFTILGFDISGTGESTIPLSVKGDELVLGIVNEARKLGNGKVAHLGFSFGGNFSAMTGLSGAVDDEHRSVFCLVEQRTPRELLHCRHEFRKGRLFVEAHVVADDARHAEGQILRVFFSPGLFNRSAEHDCGIDSA